MLDNNETQIPDLESKLEKANAMNDRTQVKMLLNNLWWQIKENLEDLTLEKRMKISALFDRYGESKRFKEISEDVLHGESKGENPDPNVIVESIRHATLVVENDETKVKFGQRMVHLAGGGVLIEKE
jgi:hypothetical protein